MFVAAEQWRCSYDTCVSCPVMQRTSCSHQIHCGKLYFKAIRHEGRTLLVFTVGKGSFLLSSKPLTHNLLWLIAFLKRWNTMRACTYFTLNVSWMRIGESMNLNDLGWIGMANMRNIFELKNQMLGLLICTYITMQTMTFLLGIFVLFPVKVSKDQDAFSWLKKKKFCFRQKKLYNLPIGKEK